MDFLDDIGAGERQEDRYNLSRLGMILEQTPAKVFFFGPQALDHRAHGTVEHEDALGCGIARSGGRFNLSFHGIFHTS